MKKLGLILFLAFIVILIWDYAVFVYYNKNAIVTTSIRSDTICIDTLTNLHKQSFKHFGK